MFELKLNNGTVIKITSCGMCPRNQTYPNPLFSFLPPTHYCMDTVALHTKGQLILNPNKIPAWCPHVPL